MAYKDLEDPLISASQFNNLYNINILGYWKRGMIYDFE